jgi:hypothetical protein
VNRKSSYQSRRPHIEQLEDRCLPAIFVVAPNGSDANPGTINAPLASIERGLLDAQPGDTVLVRGGTYHEKVAFAHGGSAAGGFLTLAAFPGERPVLDGAGVPGDNLVLMQNVDYVRLVGFELTNDLGVNDGSGVRVLGHGKQIQILDNVIHDIRGVSAMGITVYGTSRKPIAGLVIDGNQVFNCEPAPSEALTLNGNVVGFQISNNVVHDVNNIGIDMIGGETDINASQVARQGVVVRNMVYDARSIYGGGFAAGIYVNGGKNILIADNISTQNDMGLEVGAENPGIVARGVQVCNNLLYGNDKAGLACGGFDVAVGRVEGCRFLNNVLYRNDTLNGDFGQVAITFASDNTFANNIVWASADGLLIASDAGNLNNRFHHNLYCAGGAGGGRFQVNGAEFGSLAAYERRSGRDGHSLFADPQFVNAVQADFHLLPGSPARDAGGGRRRDYAPDDFDGRPRPLGPAPDIGAFEFPE